MMSVAERAFLLAEASVPAPTIVNFRDVPAYRFVEQSPQQMIILKFARIITGLQSLDALLSRGLIQEVGVIMRTMDEVEEDIQCISLAVINDSWSPLHDKLMVYFWQEEFDDYDHSCKIVTAGHG